VPRHDGHSQDNCPDPGPDGWAGAVAAHKDRTRARILAAAAGLISARGASGLAMTTLARRAGVARATLYNYFPSPGHVLEALVESEVAAFLTDLDQRLDATADPGERLRQGIDALVAWVARQSTQRPDAPRGPRGARIPDPASVHRPLAVIQDRVEQVIAAACAAGALPPRIQPGLAARFTVTLAYGIRWQLSAADSDRTAGQLQSFLLAGLGVPQPGQ
jgi:AcrR family transcriptional regulator